MTDVILEQNNHSEILFFNQMIPSVVADKLTDFLKVKVGEDKLFESVALNQMGTSWCKKARLAPQSRSIFMSALRLTLGLERH